MTPARPLDSLLAITMADIRRSSDLTVTGIARWLLEPLSFMAIYFVFIVLIARRGGPAYPLFLLAALVPFQYFIRTVSGGLTLARRYSSIISNIPLNIAVLPVSSLLGGVVTMLLSCTVFVPFLIYYERVPWPSILWLPVLIVQAVWITAGPTFAAMAVGVYAPALKGTISNLLRVLLFISTGLLALRGVDNDLAITLARYNPLSSVFESFRAVLLDNANPPLADVTYSIVSGALMLAVGVFAFVRAWPRIAKEI